ncbi:hypothetical protein ABZS29_09715 [Kribbella sp. NPDC005582]|uniref:hypothetical protein n=1 Tax=Kribbella sp. NPDC005582 TaxID=3156893 RepID=UPI0033A11572
MAPADPEPDAEQAPPAPQRPNSLFWICTAVTVLIGVFQYTNSLSAMDGFDVPTVLGLAALTLCLLALAGIYALCALERTTLQARPYGRLDLFQVSTVLVVVAVLIGVLIPPRTTSTLGLLLPFGIGYWLYHLAARKAADDKAAEEKD